MTMNARVKTAGLGAVTLVTGALLLIGSGVSIAAPAGAPAQQAAAPTPTPLSLDELSLIQPGLGTVMIEYGHRMAAVWFAGGLAYAIYFVVHASNVMANQQPTDPAQPLSWLEGGGVRFVLATLRTNGALNAAPRWVSAPLYVALGWVAIPVLPQLASHGGPAALVLLLAGGAFYTLGAVAYALRRPNLWPGTFGHHEFFHACTLIAALCHHVAVYLALFA